MEVRSYNRELAYADMLFKRPFSNIEIERDGKTRKVACVRGSRSRIVKSLENSDKKAMYQLPIIVIQRTGIQKNKERLANVWNEVKYRTNSNKMDYNLFTPVPIDISYEVSFMSKYQSDIDMIMSNFIPFFNVDLFFQCEHPKFHGLMLKNQVIMDESIQEEHSVDLDPSADDIITATCSFTFKTFLFCGMQKAQKRVTEVVSSYISTDIQMIPSETISSYVYELNNNDILSIDDFLRQNDVQSMSATISKKITCDMSVIVSSELSTTISVEHDVSEGFIPPIDTIGLAFYDPPMLSGIREYMNMADELCANEIDDKPMADRMIMRTIDDESITLVSPYKRPDWDWPDEPYELKISSLI